MLADVMAGRFTEKVQIGADLVSSLKKLQEQVSLVQQWLGVCVAEALEARGFPVAEAPKPIKGTATRRTWAQHVAVAKAKSEHRVFSHPAGGLGCLVCYRRAKGAAVLPYLRAKCLPRGWDIGLGHRLWQHRGVLFCVKCGGWAVKTVDKLART